VAFQFPEAFILLIILAPVFYLLQYGRRKADYVIETFKSVPIRKFYHFARMTFMFVFITSLVAVAAKPYSQMKQTADYVFLVDISRSMQARVSCNQPSYLDRAKRVMQTVIEGVPEGRFGIFVFERLTFPITHMTFDHDYLETVIEHGIYDGLIYDRTATLVGPAFTTIAGKKASLPDIYGNVDHVILLTDGNFEGDYNRFLAEPLRNLERENIKIVPVGIGDQKPAPIPVQENGECVNKFIVKEGNLVTIPLRTDVLQYIATMTKSRYFGEAESDALVSYLRDDALEKTFINSQLAERQRSDISWIFLLIASIALFGFIALDMDIRFRGISFRNK